MVHPQDRAVRISASLPTYLVEMLNADAAKTGLKKSTIIKMALAIHLSEK